MKVTKITCRISTLLVSLMMIFLAYAYLTQPAMKAAFQHLGFPDYFRIELAVAKLIGVTVLLIPFVTKIKEWGYAGFVIVFISAFIAHTASNDPVQMRMMTLVALALLAASYFTYHKKSKTDVQTSSLSKVAFVY